MPREKSGHTQKARSRLCTPRYRQRPVRLHAAPACACWCSASRSSTRCGCWPYLPTVLAIAQAGDSGPHSLLTWLTWLGVNATMAGWLHEHNGHRTDRAVVVNLCNTTMCLLTSILIAWFRLA